MTTVKDVYDALDRLAPFAIQEGFDNAGFLVGHGDAPVTKILVSLDITEQVIQEAEQKGCALIVAHHPVIFGGIKSATDETVTGRNVLALAEKHIAAICAHTNLDAIEGGVNTVLAKKLGLQDIGMLEQTGTDGQGRPYGIGRIGTVPEMPLDDFARTVKTLLQANSVRYVRATETVHRVAVGGGACSDMMQEAIALGCDTFVTADVKYHTYLEAEALGLNLIDAGHFATENVVCPVLKDWLTEAFPELTVTISQAHREVYSGI